MNSSPVVIVNTKLANTSEKITIPYNTGAWHILLDETKARYAILQDGSAFFFELNDENEYEVIINEFTFNHLLKTTDLNAKGELVLNFAVRIKGRLS